MCRVRVKYRGQSAQTHFFVVGDEYTPLLGRTWIRKLRINLFDLENQVENTSVNEVNNSTLVTEIKTKYAELFEKKIGKIPNEKCTLHLRDNAVPKFLPARILLYAMKEKVETELKLLEESGIISKVNSTDWGSPLVTIPKPDDTVRLYVDYKTTVNNQLVDDHYPIPKIEDVLNNLQEGKIFCKIDIYKAYLHLEVDESSKLMQTILTHLGTYVVNRLLFGIKVAPNEFHRVMSKILDGLEGLEKYFDDIIVYGDTEEQCYERKNSVMSG